MEQFIDNVTIDNRIWAVNATIELDGTISSVRMVYGCGERQFKPGKEDDTITRAGMAVVDAKRALEKILLTPPAVIPPEDDEDDFEVIEREP